MPVDFVELCEHGGHWCKTCKKFVTPEESDTGRSRSCPDCGGTKIKFCPPVPDFQRDTSFKTDPKECHC